MWHSMLPQTCFLISDHLLWTTVAFQVCHTVLFQQYQHAIFNQQIVLWHKQKVLDGLVPPWSLGLNSFEHMHIVCCSFSGFFFDGTVNCTKSAVDGNWVTDWTGSATDVEGHSTRTTHYFKLLPSRRNYAVCQDEALSLTSHLSALSQRLPSPLVVNMAQLKLVA